VTPAYRYRATLLRVVDGDTVDLRVDTGFRHFLEDRFRLYGINAPELIGTTHDAGEAAKVHLSELLALDQEIVVETFKPKDKYGRWLAVLYVGEEAIDINQRMIDDGFAVEYMV